MTWHTDKLTNHTVLLAPVHRLVKDGNVLAKIVERGGVCECTVFHGMDVHKTFDTDKHTVIQCQKWCIKNLAKYNALKWFKYSPPKEIKEKQIDSGYGKPVEATNAETGERTWFKNRSECSKATKVSPTAIKKYTDSPNSFKGYYFHSVTQ